MKDHPSFFRRAREERKVAEDKRAISPYLSNFQKLGAATMVVTGKTINNFIVHDHPEDRLNPLHRHAYSPRARAARRLWASIATASFIAGGIGAARLTAELDDMFACTGSGHSTVELKEGSNITTLAAEVPHDNTSLNEVIDEIVDENPDMFGWKPDYEYRDPNKVQPGDIKVPVNCNSLIPPDFPF